MAFTEMYGFETKDGQQARVDLSQIRSVLPSGSASGYVKAVLDGGNSVTIKGTVDGVYDLIVHYCGKRPSPFSRPTPGKGFDEEAVAAAYLRGSLPKESDESIALRDIAKALGFIGPPDSPQTVVKAVKEAQSEQGAWMLNLANALGLPSGKDKTAILSRAWAVGGQQHQS